MANLDDIIDHIEDALNAAEALRGKDKPEAASKEAAVEAIQHIRRGDYREAITTLEREFLPKWQSTEHCERDFYRATGVDPMARKTAREIERAIS